MARAWTAVAVDDRRMVAQTVAHANPGDRGRIMAAFARQYDRTVRTIERWVSHFSRPVPARAKPGPQAVRVSREARQGIFLILCAMGAAANERLIKQLHHTATFSVIRSMKQRFKAVCARRARRSKSRLAWRGAGRVWAMDYTQAKSRLPPGTNRLLMIRDLASGFRLATIPCKGEKAVHVLEALEQLFGIFGAPLVIKHDNGGAFTSERVQDLLARHGVTSLPSPARTPSYNGSIESSLGWDKKRIEEVAANNGRPGRWTEGDIEQARLQANTALLPRQLGGLTPRQAFERRRRISEKERKAFNETRARRMEQELENCADESGTINLLVSLDTIGRRATMRALLELGYLRIRRGRISTPFPRPQPDNIS